MSEHLLLVERKADWKAHFPGLPVAPAAVVRTAVKAANLIGDGLYGVDLKLTERGVMVIEVNDNPNLDAGIEDKILGEALYRALMEDFIRRLDTARRNQAVSSAGGPQPGGPQPGGSSLGGSSLGGSSLGGSDPDTSIGRS